MNAKEEKIAMWLVITALLGFAAAGATMIASASSNENDEEWKTTLKTLKISGSIAIGSLIGIIALNGKALLKEGTE